MRVVQSGHGSIKEARQRRSACPFQLCSLRDAKENLANKGNFDWSIGQRLKLLIGQWSARLLCRKPGLSEAHRVARGVVFLYG